MELTCDLFGFCSSFLLDLGLRTHTHTILVLVILSFYSSTFAMEFFSSSYLIFFFIRSLNLLILSSIFKLGRSRGTNIIGWGLLYTSSAFLSLYFSFLLVIGV